MCASAPDRRAPRGPSSATRLWLLSPILKCNRRHFKALAGARVPAAFHATDQVKLFGIDMLAGRVSHSLILDMHHPEATERDFLHEGALRNQRRAVLVLQCVWQRHL